MKAEDLTDKATKKEAAEFLGVSEKAIERYASANPPKLSKEVAKKTGGGMITYYDKKELIRLKQQMERAAWTPRQTDTKTSTALARRDATPNPEAFKQLIAAISAAQDNRPTVDLKDKEFLTIREAAALKGLTETHIKQAVREDKLKAIKLAGVRGRRIRRKDLDTYTKKL